MGLSALRSPALAYLLGMGLAALLGAVALSYRPATEIDLAGTCTSLRLPCPQSWRFPAVLELHARGFDVSLTAIRSVKLDAGAESATLVGESLDLVANLARPSEPTSLVVKSGRVFGGDSRVVLPSGSILRGGVQDPRFGAVVEVLAAPGEPAEVLLTSDTLVLPEVNRMLPDRPLLPKWVELTESYRVWISPQPHRLVHATLTAQRSAANPRIALRLRQQDRAVDLLGDPIACDAARVGGVLAEWAIEGSTDPTIKIGHFDPRRKPSGVPYPIRVRAGRVVVKSLRAEKKADAGDSRLEVVMRGKAESIKVGDVELIPTRLESLLAGSAADKGLLAVVFGLAAALFGTVSKRALDSLARQLIPDP